MGRIRVVDLSVPIYQDMPSWPTLPPVRITRIRDAAVHGATVHLITQMHTHAGTHVDLPAHFIPEGETMDDVSVDRFVSYGVVLDLSHKGAGEEIGAEDLEKFGELIRKGEAVMLYTGWSRRRGHNPDYLYRWPYLGEEGAKYLVEKRVKAVGIDALSIGGWSERTPVQGPLARVPSSVTHRILLSAGVIIVEELANLEEVLRGRPWARALFIYAPLRIRKAEGGPCRALAILEE